jgi:hypothetical protein
MLTSALFMVPVLALPNPPNLASHAISTQIFDKSNCGDIGRFQFWDFHRLHLLRDDVVERNRSNVKDL